MEFRPQDAARLVLGYLKEVHCTAAFHDLLYNMEYLQEHAENYRKSHYIITRVAGLSLVEYLQEYAAIYTIVQERLEASGYYRQNRSRSSLVKQILYLLDSIDVQSRASTPIPYINTYKHITSDNIISKSSSYDKDRSCESTNSHLDKVSISTTPTNRPQHSDKESSTKQKRLNKSIETTTPTADKSTSTDNETDSKEKSHEKCEEIFTHTFLENVELIEKLANNIKEVSSKLKAIESIVQRIEADPILVQLMAELIAAEDKKKKKRDTDLEAVEESDDGDGEGRELDYISDSSESEPEVANIAGVAEEKALRKLLTSDEEDSENDEFKSDKEQSNEDEDNDKKEEKPDESKDKDKKKKKPKSKETKKEVKKEKPDVNSDFSSDSSTDEDVKKHKIDKKAKKEEKEPNSTNSSRSVTPTDSKRKITSEALVGPSSKKAKLEPSLSSISGLTYILMRKSMTTTELLQKFKSKKTGLSSDQLVNIMTQILKKINPIKQTLKGKMYLSLKS